MLRVTLLSTALLLLLTGSLAGQATPWQGATPNEPQAGQGHNPPRPDQPVQPRHPTLHRRPPSEVAPRVPFRLTPQEQARVDWALKAWEQRSSQVKTFACSFVRREYDEVFGRPDVPTHTDFGEIRYEAPDQGLFWVREPEERRERWVCDGRSVYEFNFVTKKLTQYELPPELQGKAISNGPLPFLFGSTAEKLRQRYFLRLITPNDRKGEVWLQAYPKHRADAANFSRAELILTGPEMTPFALQIYLPNGKTRLSYVFQDIKVNATLTNFLQRNPFNVTTPIGWKRVVERHQPTQMGQQPNGPQRR
jgi:TIGR03009 family protein